MQVGRWVFGAEVSFSGMDLSQTSQPNATDTFKAEISWLTTIEGRIGLSFDNYLVFAKGGWAGGNAKLEMVTTSGTPATATETQFADGWTIGGGVELLCWSNVVLGLEYDYLDLNLSTAASCPLCDAGILAGTGPAITGDATMSSVMVRASYLFPPRGLTSEPSPSPLSRQSCSRRPPRRAASTTGRGCSAPRRRG